MAKKPPSQDNRRIRRSARQRRKLAPQTYAATFGAHKLTPTDKERYRAQGVSKGMGRGAETYLLPDGRLVSKRQLQQMGGRLLRRFRTLEERREQLKGEPSGTRTYTKVVKAWRAKYHPDWTFAQAEQSKSFRNEWSRWQSIRNLPGHRVITFNLYGRNVTKSAREWREWFLKRYGFLRRINGVWNYFSEPWEDGEGEEAA